MSKDMYSDVATHMFLMVKHCPYNKLFWMNLKLTVLGQHLWKEHRYSDALTYASRQGQVKKHPCSLVRTFLLQKHSTYSFCSRPRYLSWMRIRLVTRRLRVRYPPGHNILSWSLIMKFFLRSFSPFRWFKKGSCQFLAKECAQYWLTA